MAVQVRPLEQAAVLRRLAQDHQDRRARQALLVRRQKPAPRGARQLHRHPHVLGAPPGSQRREPPESSHHPMPRPLNRNPPPPATRTLPPPPPPPTPPPRPPP